MPVSIVFKVDLFRVRRVAADPTRILQMQRGDLLLVRACEEAMVVLPVHTHPFHGRVGARGPAGIASRWSEVLFHSVELLIIVYFRGHAIIAILPVHVAQKGFRGVILIDLTRAQVLETPLRALNASILHLGWPKRPDEIRLTRVETLVLITRRRRPRLPCRRAACSSWPTICGAEKALARAGSCS